MSCGLGSIVEAEALSICGGSVGDGLSFCVVSAFVGEKFGEQTDLLG